MTENRHLQRARRRKPGPAARSKLLVTDSITGCGACRGAVRRHRGRAGLVLRDGCPYEAALALLAENARELGIILTAIPVVPHGQLPFAVYNEGVYQGPRCGTDLADVIALLIPIASLRSPIRQAIFNREHASRKWEALGAATLVTEGSRHPGCGGWLVPDVAGQ